MAVVVPDAEALPFSLDEDFDEFTDKDHTIELVGFVCSVNAPMEVGSNIRYKLLKFGLSNGSQKKVQCLIWGASLIELHQIHLVINRVIHIDGGHCKAARLAYSVEAQGYVPFEIIIQANTIIRYLGFHEPAVPLLTDVEPTAVTFDTINQTEGQISIDGYIKTKFSSIASRFQNASYGCGSITNGVQKITINISNFAPVELEKGVAVTVVGDVDPNNGPLIINCKNMSAITRRANVPPMPEAELIRGVRAVKRRSTAA